MSLSQNYPPQDQAISGVPQLPEMPTIQCLDREKVEQSSPRHVYLIRHANSAWNYAYNLVQDRLVSGEVTEKEAAIRQKEVYFDPSYTDCNLSELGVSQCEAFTAVPNVKTVLVSPMRRCLETAYRLFKGRDDFSEIQFIVCPQLIEQMTCSCDVPQEISKTIK